MSDQQDTELKTSAGTYLRSLREGKGLSVADVSAQTYLHVNIIEALEQDAYDSLPSQAYIYGYLQSYAKLLNVPPDEVLTLYKKESVYEQPEQLPETPVAPSPVVEGSNKWLHVLIYLFLLGAGAFALWHYQDVLLPLVQREPAPPGPVSGRIEYPITIVEHPKSPFFRAPNTENEQPQAISQPGAATAQEQASETPAVTTLPPAQSPGERPDGIIPATTFSESTIVTGNGPDRIRMVVNIDCWIEIFDADNEKVFYDLARAGQTLQLSGAAPFSVLLGNADAATVEFNNVPFDFTPHITGIGIARFVLGEDQ